MITTKKPSMKHKTKALNKHHRIKVYLGDDEVTDQDIKAIILISYAMQMSTPRMRVANLDFVLNSPKYQLKVVEF